MFTAIVYHLWRKQNNIILRGKARRVIHVVKDISNRVVARMSIIKQVQKTKKNLELARK